MEQKDDIDGSEQLKNWDGLTLTLIGVSAAVLAFSVFAPSIFIESSSGDKYNFTETGNIGDTIGGIAGTFIAFAGVLLTFLAFYMQIKANKLQLDLFREGKKSETRKARRDEMTESYHKVALLVHDLRSIKSDIEQKAERIKEFADHEKEGSFDTVVLKRTTSKHYKNILEIDRLSIFKGFGFFLTNEDDWTKIFSNLYNVLEFLEEFVQETYKVADHHVEDIFAKKSEVTKQVGIFMGNLATLINTFQAESNVLNYLQIPKISLCNNTLLSYQKLIQAGLDAHGDPIVETDLGQVSRILGEFIRQALAMRNNLQTYDARLNGSMEIARDIRIQIQSIRSRKIEVGRNLEAEYNKLVLGAEGNQSIIEEVDSILPVLSSTIDALDVSKF